MIVRMHVEVKAYVNMWLTIDHHIGSFVFKQRMKLYIKVVMSSDDI